MKVDLATILGKAASNHGSIIATSSDKSANLHGEPVLQLKDLKDMDSFSAALTSNSSLNQGVDLGKSDAGDVKTYSIKAEPETGQEDWVDIDKSDPALELLEMSTTESTFEVRQPIEDTENGLDNQVQDLNSDSNALNGWQLVSTGREQTALEVTGAYRTWTNPSRQAQRIEVEAPESPPALNNTPSDQPFVELSKDSNQLRPRILSHQEQLFRDNTARNPNNDSQVPHEVIMSENDTSPMVNRPASIRYVKAKGSVFTKSNPNINIGLVQNSNRVGALETLERQSHTDNLEHRVEPMGSTPWQYSSGVHNAQYSIDHARVSTSAERASHSSQSASAVQVQSHTPTDEFIKAALGPNPSEAVREHGQPNSSIPNSVPPYWLPTTKHFFQPFQRQLDEMVENVLPKALEVNADSKHIYPGRSNEHVQVMPGTTNVGGSHDSVINSGVTEHQNRDIFGDSVLSDEALARVFLSTESARVHESSQPHQSVMKPDTRSVEVARQIAVQISQTTQDNSHRVVEVQLSPEELGSVRYRMHMTEAGVHVVIQADRPETYDLIRRHVEQLQAQLSSFGLGNASISLGYDGDNPEMPQDEETAVKALPHDESEHPEVDTLRYAPLGVDIRL